MGSDSVPGKATGLKSTLLEAGTSLLQKFAPTKKISQHVCAFHFYAHDMTRQVGELHFVSLVRFMTCKFCWCSSKIS